MKPQYTRRQLLAAGSVAGVISLAGCQALSNPSNENTPDEEPSNQNTPDESSDPLGLAYSESRSSYPSEEDTHSGWVHIVSDGESADLTFDIRFCSALGDVEPDLSQSMASEYVLRFNVDAEFSSETSSSTETDTGCPSVTHLVGGANVPSEWETLTVAVNDVAIQTVERSGTTPELRPLPDPVQPR